MIINLVAASLQSILSFKINTVENKKLNSYYVAKSIPLDNSAFYKDSSEDSNKDIPDQVLAFLTSYLLSN